MIAGCDVFLAMRYHSLIFATALCVPVVAVDYTQGGKVRSFARPFLPEELVCDVRGLTSQGVMRAVDYAIRNRTHIRGELLGLRDRLYHSSRLAGATAGRLLGERS
jgi:polysaccharide pyruvyl transferase WcaK-like protein